MTLIDAGPLIALNDRGDPFHHACFVASASIVPFNLVTTWPCIAEAMHFLGRAGGFAPQRALWQMMRNGIVQTIDLAVDEVALAEKLMEQYCDLPMDLADATLVAIADFRGWRKVFTLDAHFFAYKLRDGTALDVILPTIPETS